MLWAYVLVAAMFVAGLALFGKWRDPCPKCGHRKGVHVPRFIDGVALGPFECSKCHQQCTW